MTKLNAPAVSNEQLFEMIKKYEAEKKALQAENAALRSGARPAPQSKVDVKENGQIAFSIPSGNGAISAAYYGWQWEQIIARVAEIQRIIKAGKGPSGNRVISEAEFRQRKAAK